MKYCAPLGTGSGSFPENCTETPAAPEVGVAENADGFDPALTTSEAVQLAESPLPSITTTVAVLVPALEYVIGPHVCVLPVDARRPSLSDQVYV
jgi:hypothetical protein